MNLLEVVIDVRILNDRGNEITRSSTIRADTVEDLHARIDKKIRDWMTPPHKLDETFDERLRLRLIKKYGEKYDLDANWYPRWWRPKPIA